MRVITALVAVATLMIGLFFGYGLLETDARESQPTGEWIVAGIIVSSGVALLVAAIRNYQGSWPFLIGVGNVMLAAISVLPLLEGSTNQGVVIIIAYFLISGVLLLYSGQQLHTLRRSSRRGGFDPNIFE